MAKIFTGVGAYAQHDKDNIRVSVYKFIGHDGEVTGSDFVSDSGFVLNIKEAKRMIAELSVAIADLERDES